MRRAVVYGSNGAIGSAVVTKLWQQNYNLFLLSRNEAKLKENIGKLKQQSTGDHQRVDGFQVDVCDASSIESSFRCVAKQQLPISDLIVCTGVNKDTLLVRETDSNIDQIIQTNLISTLKICKHFSKLMIKQPYDSSSIVLIGSVVGLVGNTGQSTYASSKSALIGLVRSLAKELAKKQIRVNLVMPGFIDTPMLDGLDKLKLTQNIPLGRVGKVEDVANAVYFLSTNKSMNGQMLMVDGGLSLN